MGIFREDVVALMPHLRAFARSLTGGNRDLADDLVQDTVVNALTAQAQFTPGTNLRAWLFTILRNRFMSVISRKHVTAEVDDEGIENKWWAPAYQETALEIDAFRRAFRSLSPAHREVLVLAGVHGLAYEEIAQICHCEVGTVKSRVNRARNQLKRMLTEGELPVDPSKLAARRIGPTLPSRAEIAATAPARPALARSGAAAMPERHLRH